MILPLHSKEYSTRYCFVNMYDHFLTKRLFNHTLCTSPRIGYDRVRGVHVWSDLNLIIALNAFQCLHAADEINGPFGASLECGALAEQRIV